MHSYNRKSLKSAFVLRGPITVLALTIIMPTAGWLALGQKVEVAAPRINYARDIQPILKAKCLECHGNGQKQGGLQLETRAEMLQGGASGPALLPGDSSKSLLIQRVLGAGGKPVMPLGFTPLTAAQQVLLKAWVDQGAVWPTGLEKKHWAYIPPVKSKLPAVQNKGWVRNPIDTFILSRLEKEGLKPSPEADRVTLLRRVTLDLTGLPPTPAELDTFLADKTPNSYEHAVDRLFASPHYGEKMALPWLDTARYADSNGFQQDGDTYQYVWRDWVVKAMNSNMPFDQFTIQQLAGDLLPNATVDQKVATGFNRCCLLNGEGGAIPEEQRNVLLFDRVDVTATTWLGATMACAQCHDHKYDPLTRKDYYSFMAFFNNVPESGVPPFGGQYRIADPYIVVPTDEDNLKIQAIESRLNAAKKIQDASESTPTLREAQAAWEIQAIGAGANEVSLDPWQMSGPYPADSFDVAYDRQFDPEVGLKPEKPYALSSSDHPIKWTPHPEFKDAAVNALSGENSAFYLFRKIRSNRSVSQRLSFGSDDAIKVWLNGAQVVADKASRAASADQELVTVNLKAGENDLLIKIVNGGGIGGFYFKQLEAGIPADIVKLLHLGLGRSAADSAKVRDYYLANLAPAEVKQARAATAMIEKELADAKASFPKVMVMSDAQPRKTHLLLRGNYESPAEEVQAITPAAWSPMPASAPRNRLGLAQWLVSPENSLTARVQVNRYWQLFFGQGLVKTSENFGTQCEAPSHPELLDWLASEFRDSGWNVKKMQRLIVTSATYRQSSKCSAALRVKDPENRLVARGSRFRMPSLILRDIALSASGLLNPKIGGKPVYPYQPKGIWDGLAITNERDFSYPQSKGADLYRRSLYTFWRRTVAPANMFDASVRQTCKVRLVVTSTPLHALTTLNDVTWIEAARVLAQNVMAIPGSDPDLKLAVAFRRVCSRTPSASEVKVLHRGLDRAMRIYRADPSTAAASLKSGEAPLDTKLDPCALAAYSAVCLEILNLDEALTRE